MYDDDPNLPPKLANAIRDAFSHRIEVPERIDSVVMTVPNSAIPYEADATPSH